MVVSGNRLAATAKHISGRTVIGPANSSSDDIARSPLANVA